MPISAQQITRIITVPLAIYLFVYDDLVASHFAKEGTTATSDCPKLTTQ